MSFKPSLSESYASMYPDAGNTFNNEKFSIGWSWERVRQEWRYGSKKKVAVIYGGSCALGLFVGAAIGTLSNYIAWWRNSGKCV
jgi:hypothetical protein